jgi:hypothetical protein
MSYLLNSCFPVFVLHSWVWGWGVITSFSHLLLTDLEATEVEVLAEVFFDKNGEREAGKET